MDLLTDDLVETIQDSITDYIDKQISLLNKKMYKLEQSLKYINIDNFDDTIMITYYNVFYDIDMYLFSNFESYKNIVLLNIHDDFFLNMKMEILLSVKD